MFSTSWVKARSILLVEALLLGGSAYFCRLEGGRCLQLAAGLGIFFSLVIVLTLFSLRIEEGEPGGDRIPEQLRQQRHDFLNHLQVIYGLLQLQKTERALEYIDGMLRKSGGFHDRSGFI
ncbi:MAG TPA: hypothetical protein GX518_03740 [Firmicutes bacterium]|nr:hypothetical protein [Bacillota bacterium]